MWLPIPIISTESPSNRKFGTSHDFFPPFSLLFPAQVQTDSHIVCLLRVGKSANVPRNYRILYKAKYGSIAWNSSWPWSESCSSSEDNDTSSSSLSLSSLLSSWLLVLFPRRLSPQCTVVGLKVRKILQLNLSTTATLGTEESGCCIDFLEVLRFSFPVPVVGPSARSSLATARRTFSPCSAPNLLEEFSSCGFYSTKEVFTDAQLNKPDHVTWNVTRTVLIQIQLNCVFFAGCSEVETRVSVWIFLSAGTKKRGLCREMAVLESWPSAEVRL